jgi:hypothetical protein
MATVETRGTTAFPTIDMRPTSAVSLSPPQSLQPDASWGGVGHRYPGITIEVAYSQSERSLVEKINKVLGYSGGHVRYVIGIKIGYSTTFASIQVWRSYFKRSGNSSRRLKFEVVREPDVSNPAPQSCFQACHRLSPVFCWLHQSLYHAHLPNTCW